MKNAGIMIGDMARETATKVTTIRFYESIGLLSAPPRTDSGRRTYERSDVQRLQFIRNGRRLGFSIDEIRSLIDLQENPVRDCAEASVIAARHLADVKEKLFQLSALRKELETLAHSCDQSIVADCKIIRAIGGARAQAG